MTYYKDKKRQGLIGCTCEYGVRAPRDKRAGDTFPCPECGTLLQVYVAGEPARVSGSFERGKKR